MRPGTGLSSKTPWRFLLPAAFLFMALLFALLAGCGDTAVVQQDPDDSITFEQAPATIMGGLLAGDLPVEPGVRYVYMANTPGTPTDVSFDLDGPWNFTSGPTSATLTIDLDETEKMPGREGFPEASLVAVSSWKSNLPTVGPAPTRSAAAASYNNSTTQTTEEEEGAPGGGLNIYSANGEIVGQIHLNIPVAGTTSTSSSTTSASSAFSGLVSSAAVGVNLPSAQAATAGGAQYSAPSQTVAAGTEYNYQDISADAWRSFGRVGPEDRLRTYSGGVGVLRFPIDVGSTWTETYTQTEDGNSVDITAENTVLARGRVRVPAGAFNDCYLVQNKVTVSAGRGATVTWDYIWFVPGVGRVAEIVSQPAEKKEVFRTARSFYRLQEYHLP